MRKVAHLSDLHFGRDRPELLEPLIKAVNGTSPDLVAISGDMTQRARNWQFRAARAFVDRLKAPCLMVPGNHDVPLDNMFSRVLRPWARYRRWLDTDLEPVFSDAEMILVGVNTVNPLAWQRGWIGSSSLRRVRRLFEEAPGRNRIVMVHHPFEHLPGERKALMRGAAKGIEALAACGADMVLSGHLHTWRAETFAHRLGRAGVIQIQAGTGLSTRLRGEYNDFNLLTLNPDELTVERFVADAGTLEFQPREVAHFRSDTGGWAHFSSAARNLES